MLTIAQRSGKKSTEEKRWIESDYIHLFLRYMATNTQQRCFARAIVKTEYLTLPAGKTEFIIQHIQAYKNIFVGFNVRAKNLAQQKLNCPITKYYFSFIPNTENNILHLLFYVLAIWINFKLISKWYSNFIISTNSTLSM